MGQNIRQFYWRGGFCLLVELQRGRVCPAACAAGLFYRTLGKYEEIKTSGGNAWKVLVLHTDCKLRDMWQAMFCDCTLVTEILQILDKEILQSSQIHHTRRYGPLLGPTSSSCGGLWPLAEVFLALWAKKRAYYAVLENFWQFFVSGSNHGNF